MEIGSEQHLVRVAVQGGQEEHFFLIGFFL